MVTPDNSIPVNTQLLDALRQMNHMGGDERGGYCICPREDGSAPDSKHASVCADARKAIRLAESSALHVMPGLFRRGLCFQLSDGYIRLDQTGVDRFTVTYGKQVKTQMRYVDAAAELGACIMHWLACEGRLDNRTRREAREERGQ